MVRRRGSTLAEMLVVLSVFSIMMAVILGFYIEGSKVTARQDMQSTSYRRVLHVLDRVQTLLAFARVYDVQGDQVIFSRLSETAPLDALGRPGWGEPATLVAVRTPGSLRLQLILREGTQTRLLQQLEPGDSVLFGWGSPNRRSVSVTAVSTPPVDPAERQGEGVARAVQVKRVILLENDGQY